MNSVPSDALGIIESNLAVVIPILLVLIAALVIYLVLMARAIIDMLRLGAHSVLLTFAFLALVPVPLIVIMGIMVLIIWHYHKRNMIPREGWTT